MTTCPRCSGEKMVFAFINRGPDISKHSAQWLACGTCEGTGEVSEQKYGAILVGKRARAERLERGESLYEAATRLGIKPSLLSAIETGRA